jgi:hypothetical protein
MDPGFEQELKLLATFYTRRKRTSENLSSPRPMILEHSIQFQSHDEDIMFESNNPPISEHECALGCSPMWAESWSQICLSHVKN